MQVRKDILIAPSILSADFARLGEEVDAVVNAGADLIHFDVMDNHYVPNLTVGPLVCRALKKYGVSVPLDVHLMVEPVDPLVEKFAEAGADIIAFHPEATRHLDRSVELVKSCGCEVGLVLNPASPISMIEHVLHKLDMVLLMSVNPGFGGQPFIPYVLDKVRALSELAAARGLSLRIQVDGGIKLDNIGAVAAAGANSFVVGSGIFAHEEYDGIIRSLREQAMKAN